MYESAIRRWFDLRAQIPKLDPQTDESVSEYVEGLEYLVRYSPQKIFHPFRWYPYFDFRLKQDSSGFVHWHCEVERYLGPKECRGEVKNASIKLYPLELGSPQMPLDIRHGYNLVIEP